MAKNSIQFLSDALVTKHGLRAEEADQFVLSFFNLISEGLYRDKIVKVKGLGTFKIVEVRDRESVNVNNGERVVIEGHGKVSFTPDAVMKDLVNRPFAQFETVVLNDDVDLEALGDVASVTGDADGVDVTEGFTEGDGAQQDTGLAANMLTAETDDKAEVRIANIGAEMREAMDMLGGGNGKNDGAVSDMHHEEACREAGQGRKADSAACKGDKEVEKCKSKTGEDADMDNLQERVTDSQRPVAATGDVEDNGRAFERLAEKQQMAVAETAASPLGGDADEGLTADGGNGDGNNGGDDGEGDSGNAPEPEKPSKVWKRLMLVGAFLLGAILVYLGGYYAGKYAGVSNENNHIDGQDVPIVYVDTTENSVSPKQYTIAKKDSLVENSKKGGKPEAGADNEATPSATAPKAARPAAGPQAKAAPREKEPAAPKSEAAGQSDNAIRAQVRTGAYQIVGTVNTVTVKKGQTMKSISKFYLGDGMECYIQLHNGVNEVKEGQRLKIPKLQLKKKMSK